MLVPYFKSEDKNFYLLKGDALELLPQFYHKFDMVFAAPPIFYPTMDLLYKAEKLQALIKEFGTNLADLNM